MMANKGDYVSFDYEGVKAEGVVVGECRTGSLSVRLEKVIQSMNPTPGHEDNSGEDCRSDAKYWNVPNEKLKVIPDPRAVSSKEVEMAVKNGIVVHFENKKTVHPTTGDFVRQTGTKDFGLLNTIEMDSSFPPVTYWVERPDGSRFRTNGGLEVISPEQYQEMLKASKQGNVRFEARDTISPLDGSNVRIKKIGVTGRVIGVTPDGEITVEYNKKGIGAVCAICNPEDLEFIVDKPVKSKKIVQISTPPRNEALDCRVYADPFLLLRDRVKLQREMLKKLSQYKNPWLGGPLSDEIDEIPDDIFEARESIRKRLLDL